MTLWRYVIPAKAGDVLLVHGARPESVGLPEGVSSATAVVGTAGADHVLGLVRGPDDPELSELTRLLRPGGTLTLAMPSFVRGMRSLRARAGGLHRAGVEVEQYLWLGGSWQSPSSVVPAHTSQAMSWFVDRMFVPWSRRQWVAAQVVRSTRGRAGGHLLFPGMAVVGRRVPWEGGPT